MTTPEFDNSLRSLLRAFNTHQELRNSGASFGELSRSSHELHKARMVSHRSIR